MAYNSPIMPKLSGVFDQFANLDEITSEDLNRWLKVKIEQHALENFLANRIYYPQSVPMTAQEMEIDLAILREGISRGDKKFYNLAVSKLVIPDEFLRRFYPIHNLVAAFIDGLDGNLKEVTQILLAQQGNKKLVGSIFLPKEQPQNNPVTIRIEDQKYDLKLNTLTLLPIKKTNLKIMVDQSQEIIIDGGELGIFIDLRKR